jgi:predicted HicB family RNase H-like nuclease
VGDIIKQIIVRLEDKIHQDLKIKVIRDGVSVQSLFEDIVNAYLESNISSVELLEKIRK